MGLVNLTSKIYYSISPTAQGYDFTFAEEKKDYIIYITK